MAIIMTFIYQLHVIDPIKQKNVLLNNIYNAYGTSFTVIITNI
jgi:hypothetical protein